MYMLGSVDMLAVVHAGVRVVSVWQYRNSWQRGRRSVEAGGFVPLSQVT